MRVNVGLLDGGLGDNIARLPAIRYLMKNYPDIAFDIIVPDYLVDLASTLLPATNNSRYISHSVAISSSPPAGFDLNNPARSTKCNQHTTLRTHLTKHAFHLLCDRDPPSWSDYEYPQAPRSTKTGRRVIITTGFTAKVREWPSKSINASIKLLIERNFVPVLLGAVSAVARPAFEIVARFDDRINADQCIDLRNKTTLVGALQEIAAADLVMGVDNGLLHLAGCTDTDVIAGYTNVDPSLRVPNRRQGDWRAVVSRNCCHCQSSSDFEFNVNYTECTKKLSCSEELPMVAALTSWLDNKKGARNVR